MANQSTLRKIGEKSVIFSDNRQTVIILNEETGEDEQLSITEFAEMYDLDSNDLVGDVNSRSEIDRSKLPDESEDTAQDAQPEQPQSSKTRYDYDRWHTLLEVKNFTKHHIRHCMLANLDNQTPLESQRAYYSAMLELTYAVGDVCWIESSRINDDEGVFPVQRMLKSYGLKGANLDSMTEFFKARRSDLYEEFVIWSRHQGFAPISRNDKDKIINFIADKDNRRWLRSKVKRLLESDGELLDVANLMRKRYAILKKRLEKEKDN